MEEVEAFRTLASADRQLVLQELVKTNGEISMKKLSKQVASRRHGITPESICDKKVKHAQIRLVHEHLPLLEDRDIINRAWRDGEVTLTDKECVDQLFEAAEELETWPPDDLLKHPSAESPYTERLY